MALKTTDPLLDLADPISRFLEALGPLAEELPFRDVLPGETALLGGHVYPDADILVWRLADAYIKEQGQLVKEAPSIAGRIDLKDELFSSRMPPKVRRRRTI